MKVEIIIPSLNLNKEFEEMTKKCIETVKLNSPAFCSVILCEGGEPSGLSTEADKYVHSPFHLTFAQNVNRGLINLDSDFDYVVLLNNDIRVPIGWIESMLECFIIPNCGIATIGFEGKISNTALSIHRNGGVMMISKECFSQVGLFDETYRNTVDDDDYYTRVILAGFLCIANLDCRITDYDTGKTADALKNKAERSLDFQFGIKYYEKKFMPLVGTKNVNKTYTLDEAKKLFAEVA